MTNKATGKIKMPNPSNKKGIDMKSVSAAAMIEPSKRTEEQTKIILEFIQHYRALSKCPMDLEIAKSFNDVCVELIEAPDSKILQLHPEQILGMIPVMAALRATIIALNAVAEELGKYTGAERLGSTLSDIETIDRVRNMRVHLQVLEASATASIDTDGNIDPTNVTFLKDEFDEIIADSRSELDAIEKHFQESANKKLDDMAKNTVAGMNAEETMKDILAGLMTKHT